MIFEKIQFKMEPRQFQKRVLDLTSRIPKGRVTTYAEIARAMGTAAYRAVGTALAKNETPIAIPCHRVVRSDGTIGGYCGKKMLIEKKRRLLEDEGIEFRKTKTTNQILDFEKRLFRF